MMAQGTKPAPAASRSVWQAPRKKSWRGRAELRPMNASLAAQARRSVSVVLQESGSWQSVDESDEPEGSSGLVQYTYSEDSFQEAAVADIEGLLTEMSGTGETGVHRWLLARGRAQTKSVLQALSKVTGLNDEMADMIARPAKRPKLITHDSTVLLLTHVPRSLDGPGRQFDVATSPVSLLTLPTIGLLVSFEVDVDGEGRSEWSTLLTERLRGNVDELREVSTLCLRMTAVRLITDDYFPLLETYGDRLEDLEHWLMHGGASENIAAAISRVKRDMAKLRRVVWPMRECMADMLIMSDEMSDAEAGRVTQELHERLTYFADIMETYRDISGSLVTMYLSTQDHRTQEIMRQLTVIGAVFIPFIFLTGVYGMNFDHLPEFHVRAGYPIFWVFVLCTGCYLVTKFRQWRWF